MYFKHFKSPVSIYLTGIFLIGFLLLPLFSQQVALAEIIIASNTSEIVNQVKHDDVIYLGENHDSPAIHQQQLEIITQLQQHQVNSKVNSKPELVLAFEMFQRPFQPILDRYLAGTISESKLREQTEYDTRWGFAWEFYAPILRLAKERQIPLIALNTPTEITQKVAELGIDSLEGSDWRYIPPREEISLDNAEYRQRLQEIYQQHTANEEGSSADAEKFFAAQVLWDETMAEAIALHHQNHTNNQIIVLVGKVHVMYDYAIPDRVVRRINQPDFTQATVLLGQHESSPTGIDSKRD